MSNTDLRVIIRNKNGDKEIDVNEILIVYTVASIAVHKELEEELASLYKENQLDCMIAYKNSRFYENPLFSTYTAIEEKKMREALALYAWYEEKGEGDVFLRKFIKKGYKRLSDYVERNPTFNINHFVDFYRGRSDSYLSESKLLLVISCVMYLYEKKQINWRSIEIQEHFRNVVVNINSIAVTDKEMLEGREKNQIPALSKFQEVTGCKFGKVENIDDMIVKMEDKLLKELNKEKPIKRMAPNELFNELYKRGMYKYIKPLSGVLRLQNLNDMNFYATTEVTREEYIDIYQMFSASKDRGRLTDEDFTFYLSASLLICMMAKQYKELRDEYLNKDDSALYQAIEKEKLANEKVIELTKKEKEFESREKELNDKISEQEAYIKDLERKLKEKEETVKEDEMLRKEVISLREYVFKEQEQIEQEDMVEEDYSAQLENVKIAIVGGHQNWHQRIKQVYPGIRTILPDEKGIDLSFLSNMDIVCFETSHSNHAIYRKALSNVKDKDVHIHYFNGQRNINALGLELSKLV
ncbi:TPA: coiled-coil domain-containing protein [Bacillus paranthracis]